MEDTARGFDGATIKCDKTYACGFQGISKGWVDQCGWSLDCSWIDVTDLAPGTYALELAVNPNLVLAEVSFDNNKATVIVEIPGGAVLRSVAQPMKLQTTKFVPKSTELKGEGSSGEKRGKKIGKKGTEGSGEKSGKRKKGGKKGKK
jgi:hypothetical protein